MLRLPVPSTDLLGRPVWEVSEERLGSVLMHKMVDVAEDSGNPYVCGDEGDGEQSDFIDNQHETGQPFSKECVIALVQVIFCIVSTSVCMISNRY